jgi:guanylate kinase
MMTAAPGGKRLGQVVVISGPSGVGKSTVCHRLCEMLPAEFSVSVTTRPPRPGEQNARDYEYIAAQEFARLRDGGELLEWAEVYGHHYGTRRGPIEQVIAEGRVIILEIDIQGCIQVRRQIPKALTFFLLPPSLEEQRRRIEGRKTDPCDVIRRRLAKADGEIRYASESACYDEFIVNDDLDETAERIYRRILAEQAGGADSPRSVLP